MAKIKKKNWLLIALAFFAVYFFAAARPVTEETVLLPRWVSSLYTDDHINISAFSGEGEQNPMPFRIGPRHGFINRYGNFLINQTTTNHLASSETFWAEHGATPEQISVMNPHGNLALTIDNPQGFPLFLDGRVFIVGAEENSLTAIGEAGQMLWQHDLTAPLTAIDAANGRVLAGTLNGAIELLDFEGRQVIAPFEPGGSRLQAIFGVAISASGTQLAVISGIDQQRFLLLEQAGDIFRVAHHEFLGEGFRREVHITFADNDRRVIFERGEGLGIFDVSARTSVTVPLRGEVALLDNSGLYPYFFAVVDEGQDRKRFVTIRYPGVVIGEAPFISEYVFFTRKGNELFIGGDLAVASFEIGRR
ncbi:MAG: WD40 repeat domain-containing protein [Treponema sp.]|nr:WD40 repeat domain-containing protein [Treponema sp.]